ncbi:glutathione S-transferase family protein [Brevundimonas sp.]|uniref:glutathione S-transferase family protein n=1 Tax=Brevundimonas sp. TaxID=1871086 RepID=UPI003519BDB2
MKLILGDKAYSTWSLRPWLILKRCGATFDEVMVALNRPDTAEQIARHAPAGKVPALEVEGVTVWDSLAIALWAKEHYPDARLWPAKAKARWVARSVVCEMHSAFGTLRNDLGMGPDHPMVGEPGEAHAPSDALSADIRRMVMMWNDAKSRFGEGGPYLFGDWSIADAFFTPVAARFRHFRIDLAAHGDDGTATEYCRTLLSQPDFLEWSEAGLQEIG